MTDKAHTNDAAQHHQSFQVPEHTALHDMIRDGWNYSMHQLENKFPKAANALQYFEMGGAAAAEINEAVKTADQQGQKNQQQLSLDQALKLDIYGNR